MPKPGKHPTADETVSRLSFGFWTNILGSVHKSIAHKIMPIIFPHHPLSAQPHDWSDPAKKSAALAFIHEINTLRNRIAHHEPLWKFPAIVNTAIHPPQVLIPASTNHAQSIQRLTRLLNLYDQAMAAFDADLHRDLLNSSWRLKLDYLLSERGFERYKQCKHGIRQAAITPTQFRQQFSLIVKENQGVTVRNSKGNGVFLPY